MAYDAKTNSIIPDESQASFINGAASAFNPTATTNVQAQQNAIDMNSMIPDQFTAVGSQFQTKMTPPPSPLTMPANLAITPQSLQNAPALKVPSIMTPTASSAVIASTQPSVASAEANYNQVKAATGNEADKAQNTLQSLASSLFGQKASAQSNQVNLERSLGIEQQQKALSEINTAIASEQVALRGEQEKLRQSFGSEAQKQVSNNTLNDTYGRRLADLAIRQAAANTNITAIQSNADRQTKLLTAPIDTQIQYLTTFGKDNVDYLSGQEKEKLTFLQEDLKSQKADIQALQKAKTDMIMEIANNGGGTNQALLSKIQSATDIGQVASIAAQSGYVGALDRQLKQAQLAKIYNDIKAESSSGILTEKVNSLAQVANPEANKQIMSALLTGKAVSAGTRARLAPANSVLNAVSEFSDNRQTGQFTGLGIAGRLKEGVKGIFNNKSLDAISNQQNVDAINLKVQQWASGASLTDTQTKQVENFTPSKGDSDREVRAKLSGLYNYMLNQVESDLLTDGVNVNFAPVNLFSTYDSLQKATPEELAQLRAEGLIE